MPRFVFLKATAVAEAVPDRFWLPSTEMLDGLMPGRASVKAEAVEVADDGGANLATMTPIWINVNEVGGREFRGLVAGGALDRDGYRSGDEATIRYDQVFDVRITGADSAPELNEERARYAIGSTVLVGVTRESKAGELRSQEQFFGRRRSVDPEHGLEVELADGETRLLPPDIGPWEVAPPGEYRLRGSGQIVEDPHYLCAWLITEAE